MFEFIKNVIRFFELYKAGFRVYKSTYAHDKEDGFYRFAWNGKVIKDCCDIDFYTSKGVKHYNSTFNGHIERLG